MAGSIKKFVERMLYWTNEANLGYDQWQRWDIREGGESDCSSITIKSLQEAGFDTGSASYTGDMRANLTARGWVALPPTGVPQVGDILLNDAHHVAVCTGPNQMSYASIDENGNAHGGRSGDQTGQETKTVKGFYYSRGWSCYLRYVGQTDDGEPSTDSYGKLLDPDGYPGRATITRAQRVNGSTVDGSVSDQPGWTVSQPGIRDTQEGVWQMAKGSDLIRGMQQALNDQDGAGLKVDGLLDLDTWQALERHYGIDPDEEISSPSETVKRWQRALNEGRLI